MISETVYYEKTRWREVYMVYIFKKGEIHIYTYTHTVYVYVCINL